MASSAGKSTKQSGRATKVTSPSLTPAMNDISISVNDSEGTDSCGCCGKSVSKGQKALQCDICRIWHHITCEKVSQDVYTFLAEHNEDSIQWICRKCQSTYQRIMNSMCRLEQAHQRLEQRVASMEKKLEELFEDKVAVLDNKLEKLVSNMGAQNMFQEDLFEAEDLRMRKTNVIIHGLQESSATDRDVVHQQDENSIVDLLHELKCDDVSVNAVTRLSRKMEGEDAKPRPVKVVLASRNKRTRYCVCQKTCVTSGE